MWKPYTLVVLSLLAICVGCDTGPKSARGFSLPEGDVDRGKTAFLALQCNTCHHIVGFEFDTPEVEKELSIALGGEVASIKTYGELVTSIINPSHRLARGYPLSVVQEEGESKMANYNDVMTVSNLIDLVAFLQSRYKLIEYDPTNYPHYHYF